MGHFKQRVETSLSDAAETTDDTTERRERPDSATKSTTERRERPQSATKSTTERRERPQSATKPTHDSNGRPLYTRPRNRQYKPRDVGRTQAVEVAFWRHVFSVLYWIILYM